MNQNNREKKSADAYLKFLQSKGAPTKILYSRSLFLDAFMVKLHNKPQTREVYAESLKLTRLTLPKEKERDVLTIAREYYPFWMGDIKEVAKFEKKYGFNTHDSQWEPKPKTLKVLENTIKSDVYTVHEDRILSSYSAKIESIISDFSSITERVKLAKILLVRLRDAPDKNHAFYRTAIDHTLPLFEKNNMKKLYLEVAREFYDAWKNTPDHFA